MPSKVRCLDESSFFPTKKLLWSTLHSTPRTIDGFVFSDKDGGGGDLNGPTGKYVPRSKHPAGAMMLGAVASTGEGSPPIWFPEGFWLGAEAYIEALKETLIPWMRRVAASRGSLSCPAPFFPAG